MAGPWDVVAETPVASAAAPPAAGGGWDVVAEQPAVNPAEPQVDILNPAAPLWKAGPMPEPTLWRRVTQNAREGFEGTSAGEVINYHQSGQAATETARNLQRAISEAEAANSPVGLDSFAPDARNPRTKSAFQDVSPYAAYPVAKLKEMLASENEAATRKSQTYGAAQGERKAELAAMPAWSDAPTLWGKAIEGGAALAGQLAGGLPSPENLVGGFGPRVARGAAEGAVRFGARNAAAGAAENMAVVAATNPMVQSGQASRGEKKDFDAAEFGEAVLLGGGIGGGLRVSGQVFKALRASISKRFGADPAAITPDRVTADDYRAAIETDPQFKALAEANGITSPTDPRLPKLQDRLEARRVEETGRVPAQSLPDPTPENVATGAREWGRPARGDKRQIPATGEQGEIARRQAERDGVAAGNIDPAATNLQPRQPNETPIRVDRQGGAFREEPGNVAGRDVAAALQRADQRQLPAPGRAHLTEEEIARQRPAPEPASVETPPVLYGQERRAPQTSTDLQGQRQASEAFQLADRQRGRAGPEVRDTQVAGRPEGAGAKPVFMDEGHPVDIISRRMVPDTQGRMVEVATVRRYDPRSGQHAPDGVQYDVPVKQLKSADYAPEPRRAQDFEARAETANVAGGRARGQRMDEAQGLEHQTYRTTPPDPNAAGTARAARPEQPAGPHPGQRWSTAEEAVRHFNERQARGEAERPAGGNSYEWAKATNKARPQDRDGRFVVDENGHVMSTAAAPVRFADQKQAGKWIINVGQKLSPDQVFEIANHPGGKGFTVRETGRAEASASAEAPRAQPRDPSAPPLQIGSRLEHGPVPERPAAPPRAETPKPQEPTAETGPASFEQRVLERRDAVIREEQAARPKKDGTPDRRGYWHTGNEDQVNRRAMETARYDVMRDDAAAAIERAREGVELTDHDLGEISAGYRRGANETPEQAFNRAVDRWFEKVEAESIALEERASQHYVHDPIDSQIDPKPAAHEAPRTEHDLPFETTDRPESGRGAREGNGARGEGAREPGAVREADGVGAQAESGRVAAGEFRTDPGPDGKRQTVIPGAERTTPPAKPVAGLKGGNEPPPKGGLFDEDHRNQADIFDRPAEKPASIEQRLEQAYMELAGADAHWDSVPLSKVREKLSDFSRAEVDAALLKIKQGQVPRARLGRMGDAKDITPADRAAAVDFGGEPSHSLFFQREKKIDAAEPVSTVDRIRQAYLAESAGEYARSINLDKIRARLSDLDRATVDEGLREIIQGKHKGMTLGQWSDPKAITKSMHDAAFDPSGFDPKHLLWLSAPKKDGGSTLYSNPFASPEAWKAVAGSTGLFSDKWRAGVADLFDSIRESREQKTDIKTNAVADVTRGVFRSIDAEWRGLIGKYGKSEPMNELREMFYARPDVGRGGPVGTTFHEAVLEHSQGNINKVADALKPILSTVGKAANLTLGKDKAVLAQVVRLVENPRSIRPGTPLHDAASALRTLLDDNHDYLKKAGVDIGKVDGYFPHMLKAHEVRRNPALFVDMAAREMLANGATTSVRTISDARARAEAWRDHIMMGEAGVKEGNSDFISLGSVAKADFAKERVLAKKSPEFFNRFYHTDPIDSLATFFQRTAKKAEWTRRMGPEMEKWAELKQKMIDEGHAAAVPQVVDMVAKSAGMSPLAIASQTRRAIGYLRTWGMIGTLPLAWLSSISETAMPAVRSGSPLRAPADIGRLAYSIAGGLKKEKALGEDLGLLASGYGDSMLGQRYYGLDATSKAQHWLHGAFFKATLLEGLTHNQTAVSINAAQTFVRRLALDVASGERAALSTKLLTELGVKDHAEFSQWALRQSEGRPTAADTRDGGAHGQTYRTAVMRFVNQTIMRPSPQTQTRFSQHPVGALVQQLQSFNYSFTNNVLGRLKNLAVESIRPGSGLNGMERLSAWAPAAGMLPLMAISAAVSEGRDEVYRDPKAKPMKDWEKQLRVVSRSGLTGALDPYINLMTSARYRTEAASIMGGPVAGKIMHDGVDAIREYASPNNSDKTNAAERKLAQSFYDLVVAPAATVAALPLPAAIRTPAIQALKVGEVRRGAVDTLAGPETPKGRAGAAPRAPHAPRRTH